MAGSTYQKGLTMITKNVLSRIILTAMLLSVPGARAQIVNDGATNTLSNTTNSFTDVTIGANGSFTLLILSTNALLTNSGNGTIGLNTTAKTNEVRLLSPSARWFVGNQLMVGSNGSFNRLTVSNGATLRDQSGYLGLNASASNNTAVVTGPGSLWHNTNSFDLGFNGAGNQLVVSNGGVLRANVSVVGVSFSSSSNVAVVTGSGSLWTNATIQIGFGSAGNQLVVSNGGVLRSSLGYLGTGGSNNLALVTGANSLWSDTTDLYIGQSGVGNRLIVSGGGAVQNGVGYVGASTFGSNNLALVTGAGSTWTNLGELYVGLDGRGNQLVVSNSAQVRNNSGFIGNGASAENNLAVVTGPGTIWNNTFHTFVGFDGSDNHLTITNGGFVTNGLDALIGVNSGAEVNTVALSGLGSRWVVNRFFELGHSGDDNELLIENGASLVSGKATIGVLSASQGNQATLSGSGTTWTNLSSLEVGAAGSGNSLAVFDGACVVSSNGTIGALESASGNGVAMFGPDSRWLMEGDLYVGSNGPSSVLFLIGGGTVVNHNGIIGFGSTSSSNAAGLSGAGAVWSNRFRLFVGQSGSDNRLTVTDGAALLSDEGYIGLNSGSKSNAVIVTGPGSRWTLGFSLEVGSSGSFNSLVISNGGSVVGRVADIGSDAQGSNNLVIVTGAGSVWSNQVNIRVGTDGLGHRLLITDGGTVFASNAIALGFNSATSGNDLIQINGGTLRVQNLTGTGTFDIASGTNRLDAGLVDVDRLVMTNTLGLFEFNGGELSSGNSTVNNGQLFRVGNGDSPATFAMAGNGTHSFSNGLAISTYGSLVGNGTIVGALTVEAGGTFAPGASVGKIVLSNSPSLQGHTRMEISKSGATLTNDQIQVTAALTYGGELTVSNLGPTALALGDRFPLFSANSYTGAFSVVTLPPVNPGLGWTNKLLVDGSIEVVSVPQPSFSSITVSGTNMVISGTNGSAGANYAVLTATNITIPLSNWVSIATNQFGSGGEFSFTNGIAPGDRQRFFRIRTP